MTNGNLAATALTMLTKEAKAEFRAKAKELTGAALQEGLSAAMKQVVTTRAT